MPANAADSFSQLERSVANYLPGHAQAV